MKMLAFLDKRIALGLQAVRSISARKTQKMNKPKKKITAPISGMPIYHWSPTVEGMIILKMSK